MTENYIIAQFQISSKNRIARSTAVNSLRHFMMDPIVYSNDEEYLEIYTRIMLHISDVYPFLTKEVDRQLAKKRRSVGV